jgi:hypothetical protein
MMHRRLDGLMLITGVIAASCGKDVRLKVPSGSLAVGAYAGLSYDDDCHPGGSGKVPMPPSCIPHKVTDVLELQSSDPTVAEIVAGTDAPVGLDATVANYVVGRSPGEAVLTFRGRFDDGSERETTSPVRVKAADTMKLFSFCDDWTSASSLMLPVGDKQEFVVQVYAGTEQLVGWAPDAVAATGVSLAEKSDYYQDRPFVWQAPMVPVVLQLQSPYVSNVIGTLTAFAPDQVTDIAFGTPSESYRYTFGAPDSICETTVAIVNGQASCHHIPVELHALTPAVCSGPDGAVVWEGNPRNGCVNVIAEGTCALGLSMADRAVVATWGSPVFFVSDQPADSGLFSAGSSCTVEAQSSCLAGRVGVGVCKAGTLVEQHHCATDQVCDYLPATSSVCAAQGGVCARCRGLR